MNSDSNLQTNALPADPKNRLGAATVVVFVLAVWLLFAIAIPQLFLSPPKPLSVDADADRFSAMRADKILEELVGDGIPHPAGSPQNDIVRQRIENLVKSYGYVPIIHSTSNHQWRDSSNKLFQLENILFKLDGKGPESSRQSVMLVSHYDSVPQGPGACDDGAGTAAVLEIARMLKSEGPFQHDIIFLITDGEEYGLLGAEKFVQQHPWAKNVECVINLEARGTTGASFMFETSEHSSWLVPLFNKTASKPLTSSLFYEVYKLLPNDTDFTMFKETMQGYNFAFIKDVRNYHTEDDNYENVDRGSLQHHGDNMLGLVRELANIDFDAQSTGPVVYFDVLGMRMFWWPYIWSNILSSIAVLLVVFVGLNSMRTKTNRVAIANSSDGEESNAEPRRPTLLNSCSRLIAGFVVVVLMFAVLLLSVDLPNRGFSLDGVFDNPWPLQPLPILVAFYAISLTVAAGCAWLLRHVVEPIAIWTGTWLLWSTLALLCSVFLTGASYLFVVPALVAAVVGLGSLVWRGSILLAGAMGALSCGFLWLPLESLFFDAVGFGQNVILIVRCALVVSSMLPLFWYCQRKELVLIMSFLGIVALASSIWTIVAVA